MDHIIRGVLRFQREVHPEREEMFHKLAQGQTPAALFIACSDSRMIPEVLTQQGPGELFVVRNAGNIVPPHSPEPGGVSASIEYAVAVLGIADIVICGHSGCGAMTAVLRGAESLQNLPAVARWLDYAARARTRVAERELAEDDARLRALIEQNVLTQLENLITHPSVAEAIAEKRMRLHGWVYDIGTGLVTNYDAHTGSFAPIAEHLLAHATR